MNRHARRMTLALIIFGTSFVLIWSLRFTGSRPAHLGGAVSELPPCSSSPNGVCSVDQTAAHYVPAFSTGDQPDAAWAALKQVLKDEPRTRVVTESPGYLHVECRTAVFRFVDDLEFLLSEDGSSIHVRSASRAGYSDLGANRRRVERMRRAYAERITSPARSVETTTPE